MPQMHNQSEYIDYDFSGLSIASIDKPRMNPQHSTTSNWRNRIGRVMTSEYRVLKFNLRFKSGIRMRYFIAIRGRRRRDRMVV